MNNNPQDSNRGGSQPTVEVNAYAEWEAYQKLPKVVRDIAREECLFDYSAEQLLNVWVNHCYKDVSEFRRFMRFSDKQVIQETKGDWPNPPTGRKTSAYERAVERQNKLRRS